MTAIVCVDKNWAIGRENRLLFRISADLKHFRALTTGKDRRDGEEYPAFAAGRQTAAEPAEPRGEHDDGAA